MPSTPSSRPEPLASSSSRPSVPPPRRARRALAALFLAIGAWAAGCRFDRSDRWLAVPDEPPECEAGARRCISELLQHCDGQRWVTAQDCGARSQGCSADADRCLACTAGTRRCQGKDVVACLPDGSGFALADACDTSAGFTCQNTTCVNLCEQATTRRSNVGCEYWGADLDNAALGASNNAAGQQYAIVVSNPQADVPVQVTITQDDGTVGGPASVSVTSEGAVAPGGLRVFKLGPREVDGSADGTFDTGTGTALGRRAYRVVTDFPVVAYQFNPLDNANVFSNDASLLKPVSALGAVSESIAPAYVVLGWPQTIAKTDDPNTNFDNSNLRAFLTLVGTRPGTHVRVTSRAPVIPGGPVAATPVGGVIEATLEPFEVLNLETGSFNADFTGSLIEADGPVVVFSGSEASDAPWFSKLSERFCCADHLEDQLDPLRTVGKRYVAAHGPSRTRTLAAAGGQVGVVPEPDFFRVLAVHDGETHVTTTLPAPDNSFVLTKRGEFRQLTATVDFTVTADAPVALGNVSPSQEAAGIKRGLPGGDPSFVVVPPIEQWRSDYTFLTPDKYAFDFVTIIAPSDVAPTLDGQPVNATTCLRTASDGRGELGNPDTLPAHWIYTCQLSFPVVDPTKMAPDNVLLGAQNDGVHRVVASKPVGVLVSGFDNYVSYGYAAGTQLEELQIQ